MSVSRRNFIRSVAASGAAMAAPGCVTRLFSDEFDENLTVFLSDIHVTGRDDFTRWLYTRTELAKRVNEILAMRPLPRNVVTFGDLSLGVGETCDYSLAVKLLKPLVDAGIRVTHAMGNHDNRAHFLEYYPGYAKYSAVPGRIVSEVDLGFCDLVLLDTLEGDRLNGGGLVDGELNKAMLEYIADTFPKRTRPFIAGAHHGVYDIPNGGKELCSALINSPYCVGWVHGHDHNWVKRSIVTWGNKNEDTIRSLTLPSAGLWGDIGYVVFRTDEECAVASLVQHDYWFNDVLHPGESRPQTWQDILRENKGETCRFSFERRQRNKKA